MRHIKKTNRLAFLDIKLYFITLLVLQQCGKSCQWNGMKSAETKPCTYRNLAFQFNGETMHYSVICIKVVTYPFGKIYIFIPHMIYKHKFCINKEPNVNNKTINALEENVVFGK